MARTTEADLRKMILHRDRDPIEHGRQDGSQVASWRPSTLQVRDAAAPLLMQSFFIPGPLPGANDIIRKHHMVYSTLKSRWGTTIARCILVAKLKPVRHCHVAFTWNEKHDRRDPDNVIFGQKFVLDALHDTKIIPNDTREFILSLTHCVLTYSSKPGVHVTITEVKP